MSTTISGRNCQRWDSQSPHPHSNINPEYFHEDDITNAQNYCRFNSKFSMELQNILYSPAILCLKRIVTVTTFNSKKLVICKVVHWEINLELNKLFRYCSSKDLFSKLTKFTPLNTIHVDVGTLQVGPKVRFASQLILRPCGRFVTSLFVQVTHTSCTYCM